MRRLASLAGPAVFAVVAALAVASTVPDAAVRFGALVAGLLFILFLIRGSLEFGGFARGGVVLVCLFGALLLMALAAVTLYPLGAGGRFDPTFLLENLPDAVSTVRQSLSPSRMILPGCILAAAAVAGYRLVRFAKLPVSLRQARYLLLATLGCCLALGAASVHRYFAARRRNPVPLARFQPTKGLATASEEPVVMLQLESVNALAEAGLILPDRSESGAEARMFQDGVFFPFFVAGNMMTNRGQATILCGATWELGDSVARHPDAIPEPCLPELLRRSGYRTVFYSDSRDADFGNTRDFAAKIGFDETHFGDVARPGDPVRRWGYEDTVYYRRVVGDLAARYPDPRRLFVYVAASADHFPFDEVPGRDSDSPALRGPSFRAGYLRTLAEEDRALAAFRQALGGYLGGQAHLFVASDHSFPVGVNQSTTCAKGASPDNFLTTMAYVPPVSRAAEFCVGTRVNEFFGQESILPTVFEVLNRKRYPKSLGPVLWRFDPPAAGESPPARPCATFSQPYDGRYVVAVRDGVAFRYSFRNSSVTLVDLRRDILERHPRQLLAGISPDEFASRFGCDSAG